MESRKFVILCKDDGTPTGTVDILEAHTGKGLLHRAFSIYLFRNDRKEILVQKRSKEKMLWPNIWANTCCSHSQEKEDIIETGQRRLQEEFGFTHSLKESLSYVYRAEDPSGRGSEHEYVTILVGDITNEVNPQPNPSEISEWKWIEVPVLQEDINKNPKDYAPWFCLGLQKLHSVLLPN